MISAKQVADILTLSRLILALTLTWLGYTQGAAALPLACWLLIASWTTDVSDGWLATHSRRKYSTWIGEHDLLFDISVSVGIFAYLLFSRLVPLWLGVAYILLWMLIFWRLGFQFVLGMLFQAPLYGWFIGVALFQATNMGLLMLVWIALMILVTWPRFPQQVVPGFLEKIKAIRENEKVADEKSRT